MHTDVCTYIYIRICLPVLDGRVPGLAHAPDVSRLNLVLKERNKTTGLVNTFRQRRLGFKGLELKVLCSY